ncbi:MAG: signal peptidase II, partial [Ilumatobacteraceae bacterium]
ALGNLVDRLFRGDGWLRGSVVDFIDFQWFPIFNVADMGVNVGGALFVLWSAFAPQDAPTAATGTDAIEAHSDASDELSPDDATSDGHAAHD